MNNDEVDADKTDEEDDGDFDINDSNDYGLEEEEFDQQKFKEDLRKEISSIKENNDISLKNEESNIYGGEIQDGSSIKTEKNNVEQGQRSIEEESDDDFKGYDDDYDTDIQLSAEDTDVYDNKIDNEDDIKVETSKDVDENSCENNTNINEYKDGSSVQKSNEETERRIRKPVSQDASLIDSYFRDIVGDNLSDDSDDEFLTLKDDENMNREKEEVAVVSTNDSDTEPLRLSEISNPYEQILKAIENLCLTDKSLTLVDVLINKELSDQAAASISESSTQLLFTGFYDIYNTTIQDIETSSKQLTTVH